MSANRAFLASCRQILAWTCLLLTSNSFAAFAASPSIVTFGTSHTVACRDVTPPEMSLVSPWEKMIEATFDVSLLIDGDEALVEEVLVVFSSPQRRLRVADFLPRTETISDIVGPIERSDSQDWTKSLQAGIGGTLGAKHEIVQAQISPSLTSGITRHENQKESYQRLPPRKLLVASGTLQGGHGVFFKLKPSTQESLQGARPYGCRFIVPREWRGDWLLVSCLARGQSKRQLLKKTEDCGRSRFIVGLYLEGDPRAHQLAQRIDRLQSPPGELVLEELFGEAADADLRQSPSSESTARARPGFASLVQFYRQAWRLPIGTAAVPVDARQGPGSLAEACQALGQLSGDRAALPPELED